MKKHLTMLLVLLLAMSCSSTKKERELEAEEHEKRDRDYTVIDYSSKIKPEWIEDAELWAKQYGKDLKKYRYFSFMTEPKVNRKIACDLAKANAKAYIAGEIATFIDQQIAQSLEGQSAIDENNPHVQAMREYAQSTLASETMALVNGAQVNKTYWEKRSYQKKMGAMKDFKAYSCGALVRMPQERLMKAIDEAATAITDRTEDPEAKETVKNALNNASENFVKARQGKL